MEFSKKIQQDLEIDEPHLNDEILKQPGLYAYYAHQCSEKRKELDFLSLDLDVLKAEKDSYWRDMFTSQNEKFTETKLSTMISKDEKVIKLKKQIIEVDCEYKILRGVVIAFEQRKDCLVSISANRREELKNQVGVIE